METQSDYLVLSRIPDSITQLFHLAQDELQLNRSYFSQLIQNRCSRLDQIRNQRDTLTKTLAQCQLTKPQISNLNKILGDITTIKSDIRAKQRNTKMLKDRLAEVLLKRHEVAERRAEWEREIVQKKWRTLSLDRLHKRAVDVRQVSMGKLMVGEGNKARFCAKEAMGL